jgi:hypothetical protein
MLITQAGPNVVQGNQGIGWTFKIKSVRMLEIFVDLTCINQTPAYSKHKNWS